MASVEFFMYVMCVYIMCMYEYVGVWMDRWMTNFKFESYPLFLMNTENIVSDDQRL